MSKKNHAERNPSETRDVVPGEEVRKADEVDSPYPGKSKDTLNFARLMLECLVIFMTAAFLGLITACVGYVCYAYSYKRWGMVKGIGYGLIGGIIGLLCQAFVWGQFIR